MGKLADLYTCMPMAMFRYSLDVPSNTLIEEALETLSKNDLTVRIDSEVIYFDRKVQKVSLSIEDFLDSHNDFTVAVAEMEQNAAKRVQQQSQNAITQSLFGAAVIN